MALSLPNLRHLLALHAAAREGSLTAAARTVHLSQPAVTQALAALERSYGASLLARSATGVQPSAAGLVLLPRLERALAQLREGLPGAAAREDGQALRTSEAARAREEPLQVISAVQLAALAEVVENGGFAATARMQDGASKAALHRATRTLERRLGVALFETTSHGLRPTREAERLARRVRLAAAELQQARAEIAALDGAEQGSTVIGAMPLARSMLVPAAVLDFAAARPWHRVAILDGPYESMVEALRSGRADLLVGALREAPPHDVVQEPLFEDPLALLVRAAHPLAARRSRPPSLRSLARYAWIAPRSGSPLRRHFDALAARLDTSAAAPIECNSLAAARALLVASDRIMLLSAQQAHQEIRAGQLVALPHPDGRVTRTIGLTSRRGWRPTPAQQALLERLREHARRAGVAAQQSD